MAAFCITVVLYCKADSGSMKQCIVTGLPFSLGHGWQVSECVYMTVLTKFASVSACEGQ
jgi:hypothetical protein